MTLIVENGTGLADAESYVTLAQADAYHLALLNQDWSLGTVDFTVKEAALRRATAYIDGAYRGRWAGRIATAVQALSWPRADARTIDSVLIPANAIPRALIQAVCECALRELVSPGSLSPDVTLGDRVTSETVDVLEVEYAEPQGAASVADALPKLVAVDRLLAPILRSSAGACLVLRA